MWAKRMGRCLCLLRDTDMDANMDTNTDMDTDIHTDTQVR